MATTFYYENTLSALAITGLVVRSLSTSRGSALITKTQTSDVVTPPQAVIDPTFALVFAYRVAAFSSTTGTYTFNHWGLESSTMANFGAGCSVAVYTAAGAFVNNIAGAAASATEYTTAAAAWSFTIAGTAQSVADGNWIVVQPAHAQAGGTFASGYTLSFGYNGPTAAANGDTFATFPDTITAYVAPASRVPYTSPYIQVLAQ